MKKHLSIKLIFVVVALSIYSYMVIKNGKGLNAEQTSLSSQAPQANSSQVPAETSNQN